MPNAVSITEADNHRSVEVAQGTIVTVSLEENPTTGFNWQLGPIAPNILKLMSDDHLMGARSSVGGGGVRQFQFQAMAAGRAAIRLSYRRSWEPPENAASEFSVDIIVR